jgi:hypothetical protein
MRLYYPIKHKNIYNGKWHKFFALKPVRVGEHVIWLEHYDARHVTESEGNWAGGYMSHWEYRNWSEDPLEVQRIWVGPTTNDGKIVREGQWLT